MNLQTLALFILRTRTVHLFTSYTSIQTSIPVNIPIGNSKFLMRVNTFISIIKLHQEECYLRSSFRILQKEDAEMLRSFLGPVLTEGSKIPFVRSAAVATLTDSMFSGVLTVLFYVLTSHY